MSISNIRYGRSFCGFFLLMSVLVTLEGWAMNWDASLEALSGYRCDRITTSLKTFNAASQLIETNKLIVDGLDIVELGFKGRVTLADQWSLRAYAIWGIIADGKYHENLSDKGVSNQKNTADLLGRLSQDDSISLGYCYPVLSNLAIEGLLGWSYDKLTLKMHDFKEDGLPDSTIDKLYYRMLWKGPWLGGAFTYDQTAFRLYTGYEFHLPYWKASYCLPGLKLSTSAFSDRRWAKDAQGHIAFVELSWVVLCHCKIGLRAQCQYWKAKKGNSQPILDDLQQQGIPAGQFSRVSRATWSSAGIQCNLGVIF